MPTNWVTSTSAAAGQRTFSTGPNCARVTNGPADGPRAARTVITRQLIIMITASQNGKNPLFGPSVPQPMPRRNESMKTTPPNGNRTDAVRMSARRILFLEQAALDHEVLVQLLVFLDPFDEFGARGIRGFQRPFVHVPLPLGRVGYFLEEGLVPLHGFLGHVGSSEDAAEHEIVDVGAQGLLHRGDVLPFGHRNPGRIEHRQRP